MIHSNHLKSEQGLFQNEYIFLWYHVSDFFLQIKNNLKKSKALTNKRTPLNECIIANVHAYTCTKLLCNRQHVIHPAHYPFFQREREREN